MGAFYGSIHLRSDNQAAEIALAQRVADQLMIGMFVGPAIAGWVGVYPQESGQDESVGGQLAQLFDGYVLHVIVHDDDVFAYCLYEQGILTDSYWSAPGYFGARYRAADQKKTGRPEAFRPLIGERVHQLIPILDRDSDQPVFISEKLEAFAQVLGIVNAVQSYEILEEQDDVPAVHREMFVRISPRGAVTAPISSAEPDSESAKAISYLGSGSSRMVNRDYAGALIDLDKALNLQPDMRLALFMRGSVKHFTGDFAGAIVDQTRAISISPDRADAYEMRGMAKLKLVDIAGALLDFNKAIELEPDSASAYSFRGDARRAHGDLANALADYDRALDLDDDRSKTWNNRGFAKKKMGDLRGALSDFNEALYREADPGFYKNRADVRRELKNFAGAMADYDEAIRLSLDHALALNGRGLTKSAAGDHTGAIADYDRAIENRPDDPKIWKNRSLAKQRVGDLPGALVDVEKAISLGGPTANFLAGRAEVRRLQKDFAGALRDFDKAIELGHQNVSAFNSRALVKFALGDLTGSLADLDLALAGKPTAAQMIAIAGNRNALLKKLSE